MNLSNHIYKKINKMKKLRFKDIIPGLIASWMDRQGVLRTVSVILIVASIVNLFMMLLFYFDQYRILYV